MKLLGRDIAARELLTRLEERLRLRGLATSEPLDVPVEPVEPRVEPLAFNLHALEEHADSTRPLPLHTHRGGAGQLVLVAKWAFRKSCQVLINETLGRQRVFNGHVRDAYAQLSAEVVQLRREVEQLRAAAAAPPAAQAAPQPLAEATPATQAAPPAPAEPPAETTPGARSPAPPPQVEPDSESQATSPRRPPRGGRSGGGKGGSGRRPAGSQR